MKILPPQTALATAPIGRRHTPRPSRRYQKYRPCLRWEFGFTCAFCQLHESDIAPLGAEGLGVTTAEHFVPVSEDPSRAREYENLLYACRWCNRSRSNSGIEAAAGRLLAPTEVAWADHFRWDADEIEAISGVDGERTCRVYDLNDRRKVRARSHRRRVVSDRVDLLRGGPDRIRRLVDLASRQRNPGDAKLLLAEAHRLRRGLHDALRDLSLFRAIPVDADERCRCGTDSDHSLPSHVAEQVTRLPDPE